jgi:hypothetical protein
MNIARGINLLLLVIDNDYLNCEIKRELLRWLTLQGPNLGQPFSLH